MKLGHVQRIMVGGSPYREGRVRWCATFNDVLPDLLPEDGPPEIISLAMSDMHRSRTRAIRAAEREFRRLYKSRMDRRRAELCSTGTRVWAPPAEAVARIAELCWIDEDSP